MKGPVFFGVRHLSPAAAFQLRKALDQAEPELVLVEGPSDLNSQPGLYPAAPGAYRPVALRRLFPGDPGHFVGE